MQRTLSNAPSGYGDIPRTSRWQVVAKPKPGWTAIPAEVDKTTTSKRVLLVDDSPALLELLARALRQAGHEVGTATDGDEGLEKFRGGRWDLVITDLQMPRMSGEELAKAVQADDPEFPVIIITGDPGRVRGSERFFRVLAKPFCCEGLLALVAEAPMPRWSGAKGPPGGAVME